MDSRCPHCTCRAPGHRRRHALGIEHIADPLETGAVGVEFEDAMDQRRLVRVYNEMVCGCVCCVLCPHIPQRFAASRATAFRLADQSAPGGVGNAHPLLLADHALH